MANLREMSRNRLGVKMPPEHRRKISEALNGRRLSDEHRQKVAAVNADPALSRKKAEARKLRRKTAATHRQVHKRLFRDKGPASRYQCVDCSEQADAWTHDWSTWQDVAQELRGKRLTFSTNLAAYEPRCHACHNRLDRGPRPWDPIGSRQGAKLKEADVSWIRTCGLDLGAMADALGVSKTTVCRIRKGATWKHVG